jgi:membrane protease YdiL (CAAX protease family)
MFFRGYYGILLRKPWQLLLVSSVLWAAPHGDPVEFIPLVAGCSRERVYARIHCGSFYPSLALHVITNILALAFYFWWS